MVHTDDWDPCLFQIIAGGHYKSNTKLTWGIIVGKKKEKKIVIKLDSMYDKQACMYDYFDNLKIVP